MFKPLYIVFLLFILLFPQTVQAESDKKKPSSGPTSIAKAINEKASQNARNSSSSDSQTLGLNDSSLFKKAENDDACARTKIAYNYWHRKGGLKKDYKKSIKWYERVLSD